MATNHPLASTASRKSTKVDSATRPTQAAAPSRKYTSKLLDKNILVIGGTTGIGFAVAEAALEYGASVTVTGQNPERLARAVSRLQAAYPDIPASHIRGERCDLAHPEGDALEQSFTALFEQATNGKTKPIDHVVFTAGDALKITPVKDVTVEQILKSGIVRFIAPIILGKIAPKYFVKNAASSITFTGGSNSSKPMPNWTVMAGWGAGVEGVTRGLAVDLKPIRVNVVAPGSVHTELYDDIPKEKLEGVLEGMRKATLTGNVGAPEEVAEAYLYAMRDSFVTGQVLQSDGGRLLA
jgi:NAD(P)-dependent dehydrogenase (short-subunit alcohol dehydrogenase family)